MQLCERELGRNALAIRVPFGGGQRGCLGLVYSDAKYIDEAGEPWAVPASEGAYPTFLPHATTEEKKKAISEFIEREKGIKIVRITEELLKGQFLEAVDEDYVIERKEEMREYDGVSLRTLLQHVKEKYAKMDDDVFAKIMSEFEEPPDMSRPVDKYYARQERCKRLLIDTEAPITEADMVLLLTRHMGKVAGLAKQSVKFRKRPSAQKTWKLAKEFFRQALEDVEAESRAAGIEPDFLANATIVTKTRAEEEQKARDEAEQKARDDIAAKMSGSFDALVSAAVAKAETIDANAATIASLTKSIAQLTAANQSLTAQLAAASAKQPALVPETAGARRTNTAGVSCPAIKRKGKWYFLTPQACSKCGRNAVKHVPEDCRGPTTGKGAKE